MGTLENARKAAGYSQGAFAQKLDLAPSTYCQYEIGTRAVPANIADKICSLLNVTREDIFLPKTFTVSK